jgi:hypothetical protein
MSAKDGQRRVYRRAGIAYKSSQTYATEQAERDSKEKHFSYIRQILYDMLSVLLRSLIERFRQSGTFPR